MSFTNEDIDLFDGYSRGELTDAGRESFEERLATESGFQERFEQYLASVKAIETFGVREEMGAIIEAGYARARNRHRLQLAAAILLLVSAIPLLFYWLSAPTDQSLYADYYEPYPAAPNVRGDVLSDRAMDFYRKGQYKPAISLFEEALVSAPEAADLHIYLGNCYLLTGKAEEAIRSFELLKDSKSTPLIQYGEWYRALAYLKQSDRPKALELLQQIAMTKHLYKEKAAELIGHLE